jgi:preprotein translocase subunit YajC
MFSVLANALVVAATTTTKAKSSSFASSGFIFLLLIVAGAYLLFIRPQRMKMRQQMVAPQINVGDEVVTQGGLIGHVVRFDGDRVTVEIAPGTNVMVLRTALGRRMEPTAPPDYSSPDVGSSFDDSPPEDGTAAAPPGAPGEEHPQSSGDSSPSAGSPT